MPDVPDSLTIATCIGCGAMERWGTCDEVCAEVRLDLVGAGDRDRVRAAGLAARTRIEAFRPVAAQLVAAAPTEEAYRSLQRAARDALHRHGRTPREDAEPVDPVTAWWCPRCGAIEVRRPCIGVCIRRPADWVPLERFERERLRVLAELDAEAGLGRALRRVASVTPRPGHWERTWDVVRREARAVLVSAGAR
jgi:hypothetical protein